MYTFKCEAITVIVIYFHYYQVLPQALFLFVCLIFIFGLIGSPSSKRLH